MNVTESIRTLLAIRNFADRPVSSETLHKILEAGQFTGSARNLQPWHFVVVQSKDTLQELGRLATTGPYVAQAPLAIAVVVEDTSFGISDGSRAIQSMVLAAWEEGVGSNWVGFGGFEEIKKLLGIPRELNMLALLPFGYPAQAAGKGKKKRKPLSEIAYRERFGQSF
jgi:nitroreductase